MRATRFALLLLAIGCERPAPAEGRASPDGWDLYCRSVGGDTTFVLVEREERVRFPEEIAAKPSANGMEGLDRLLATLAPGEVVICRAPGRGPTDGYFVPMYTTDLGKAIEARGRARGVVVKTGDW